MNQPNNNFTQVVQPLLVSARIQRNKLGQPAGFTRAQFLSEFCTVGFTGARQTGKTTWVFEQLQDNPDAIAFVSYPLQKAMGVESYAELVGGVPTSVSDRIYTLTELKEAIAQSRTLHGRDELREHFTQVYVDDAAYVFEKVRRSAFYMWLAGRQKDVEVVLVN